MVCHTKSSVTQLIEVFDYIGRELDHGKQVDVIYLDMSNAFDRVYLQALKSLVKLITEHRNEKYQTLRISSCATWDSSD